MTRNTTLKAAEDAAASVAIWNALKVCHGNVGAAAERLGMCRRSLERRMQQFNLRKRAGELRAGVNMHGPKSGAG